MTTPLLYLIPAALGAAALLLLGRHELNRADDRRRLREWIAKDNEKKARTSSHSVRA